MTEEDKLTVYFQMCDSYKRGENKKLYIKNKSMLRFKRVLALQNNLEVLFLMWPPFGKMKCAPPALENGYESLF